MATTQAVAPQAKNACIAVKVMCCPHHQEDTPLGINLSDKQKNNKIGAPPYSRRFSTPHD